MLCLFVCVICIKCVSAAANLNDVADTAIFPPDEVVGHKVVGSVKAVAQTECETVPPSCAPNCGVAISTAMRRCSLAGGGAVRLSSGVYHLNDSFTDRPQLSAVLALDGLTDVALIGKLAQTGYTQSSIDQSTTTLLVHGLRGAVWMHNCTRVRFHSLDFDMARLPYTYGRAIRATDLSTTIEFDPKLYSFESRAQQPWQLRVTNVNEFDPMDWRLNGTGQYNSATAPVPVTLDRPGQLTLHGVGMMQGVRVGKHYILRNTYYGISGISCGHSYGIEFERVRMWSAAGMGFVFSNTVDVSFVDSGVARRPGLALSACADASHFIECGGALKFIRFRAEGQGDDGMNVHGAFHDVRAHNPTNDSAVAGMQKNSDDYVLGGTVVTLTLGNRPVGGPTELTGMTIGARYQFRNRHTFASEGVGILRSYAAVMPRTSRLQTATFELQPGANITQYALLSNADMEPSVHIQDSYFGTSMYRGTLLKTSNVLVENTLYNHTGSHCVEAWPDGCYWFESDAFRNWTLRNNTFQACVANPGGPPEGGVSDVFVAACLPSFDLSGKPLTSGGYHEGRPITVGHPFADGAILYNRFVQLHRGGPRSAINVKGFDGLRVLNNTVTLLPWTVQDDGVTQAKTKGRSTLDTMRQSQQVLSPPPSHGVGGIRGSLDGFTVVTDPSANNMATVFGWVVDPLLQNETVVSSKIQVEVDGTVVITTVANSSRMDLAPFYCTKTSHCPFGYHVLLPGKTVEQLATGNHTIGVLALRPTGVVPSRYLVPMADSSSALACVTPLRRKCMGVSCRCGSPPPPTPPPPPAPPRLSIGNSIRCEVVGNMCDDGPCTVSNASECAPGGAPVEVARRLK